MYKFLTPFLLFLFIFAPIFTHAAVDVQLIVDVNKNSYDEMELAVFNDEVYFTKEDSSTFNDFIWKSDGTPSGTVQLLDPATTSIMPQYPGDFMVGDTIMYFTAYDSTSFSTTPVWRTDGTAAGTFKVGDAESFFDVNNGDPFLVFGDDLYYEKSVYNGIDSIWKSDGTANGFTKVTDLASGQSVNNFFLLDGELYVFLYTSNTNTYSIAKIEANNNPVVTTVVSNLSSYAPGDEVAVFDNKVFFENSSSTSGAELWSFDGTNASLVKDMNPGTSGSYPRYFKVFNDVLYFQANGELWRTDGTEANTSLVKDINAPASGESRVFNLTVSGDYLFFAADDSGGNRQVWKMNTSEQVSLVEDIYPGNNAAPDNFIDFNNTLYFSARADGTWYELWSSDGDSASLVTEIQPGLGDSDPQDFAVANNRLFFSANTSGADPDRDLYMLREIVPVTLSFDSQGGAPAPSAESKLPNETTVAPSAPARTGYDFVGWNTDQTGATGTTLMPGDTITFPAQNATYYAIWDAVASAAAEDKKSKTVGFRRKARDVSGVAEAEESSETDVAKQALLQSLIQEVLRRAKVAQENGGTLSPALEQFLKNYGS